MHVSRKPEDLISDLLPDGRVTRAVFVCLDAAGQHVACEDPGEIEELASDLLPGYRIIRLDVRARPPQPRTLVIASVTAPDPPDDVSHVSEVTATAADTLLAASGGTLLAASGGRLAGGESPEASS